MDNNLIRASYRLTTNETRLIYAALAQMPKNAPIDPKTPYYITKNDFIRMGVEPKNVAREIRAACNELLKRTITIKTPIGDLGTHWVHNVLNFKSEIFEGLKKKYAHAQNDTEFLDALRRHNLLDSLPVIINSEENIVARIVFHEDVIPYLSELKSHFTQFMLTDVYGFSGAYSFRFYQMMMQFKNTGYCKVHLDELRELLMLGDTYSHTADLKRRVIEAAIDEINQLSPYQVEYKLFKTGKKFTHFELKFKEKVKTKKEQPPVAKEAAAVYFKLSSAQLDAYSQKLAQLPDVQTLAHIGENMQMFTARLYLMLKDAQQQVKLQPYLQQLGFKAKPE